MICVKFSVRLCWILLLSAHRASSHNVYCSVGARACMRVCADARARRCSYVL